MIRPFVRPARAADLPACAAILNDFIDEMPWTRGDITRDLVNGIFDDDWLARRRAFVSGEPDALAGYVAALADVPYVSFIRVVPAFRRRGIGAQLMTAMKRALPEGFTVACWQDAPGARQFFATQGLEVTGAGNDSHGLRVWMMHWGGRG